MAGEGGTFAIYALLSRYSNIAARDPRSSTTLKLERHSTDDIRPSNRNIRGILEDSWLANAVLKVLAVFGVSLIMADGVLTPAQSVLGAIQGKPASSAPQLQSVRCIAVSDDGILNRSRDRGRGYLFWHHRWSILRYPGRSLYAATSRHPSIGQCLRTHRYPVALVSCYLRHLCKPSLLLM